MNSTNVGSYKYSRNKKLYAYNCTGMHTGDIPGPHCQFALVQFFVLGGTRYNLYLSFLYTVGRRCIHSTNCTVIVVVGTTQATRRCLPGLHICWVGPPVSPEWGRFLNEYNCNTRHKIVAFIQVLFVLLEFLWILPVPGTICVGIAIDSTGTIVL